MRQSPRISPVKKSKTKSVWRDPERKFKTTEEALEEAIDEYNRICQAATDLNDRQNVEAYARPETPPDMKKRPSTPPGVVNKIMSPFRSMYYDMMESWQDIKEEQSYGPPYLGTSEENQELLEVCAKRRPNLSRVHDCLSAGADPHTTQSPDAERDPGYAPLHYAARHGSVLLCRLLGRAKADVNQVDVCGRTPLMFAAEGHSVAHANVSRWLLRRGADPNLRDRGGTTALMVAIDCRNVTATRILLQNGALVERPLHMLTVGAMSEMKYSRAQYRDAYLNDEIPDPLNTSKNPWRHLGGPDSSVRKMAEWLSGHERNNAEEKIFELMVGAGIRQEMRPNRTKWWSRNRSQPDASPKDASQAVSRAERKRRWMQQRHDASLEVLRTQATRRVEKEEADARMRVELADNRFNGGWHRVEPRRWEYEPTKKFYSPTPEAGRKQYQKPKRKKTTDEPQTLSSIQRVYGQLAARETEVLHEMG